MTPCGKNSCHDCPEQWVCHCLQVTEAEVVDTIVSLEIRGLRDLQRQTGAGDGCTACHGRLKQILASYASSSAPICSVR